MKRLSMVLLLAILLAACASPTQPPAPSTQAVPVTGETPTAPPVFSASQPAMPTEMPTLMATSQPTEMPTLMPTEPPAMMPTVPPTMMATGTPSGMLMGVTPESTLLPGGAVAPAAGGQVYTVLVGAMDMNNAASVDAFFPATLHIHPGDTVVWKQNVNEIHTVTFLGNQPAPQFIIPMPNGPQGAMMFNPQTAFASGPENGQYDGAGFANSGIMGTDPGQVQTFTLSFTKPGTYDYICAVHTQEKMLGTIVVDDASTPVPSPAEAAAEGQAEMNSVLAQVPAVVSAAQSEVQPDTQNADGTTTHHILVGYTQGQIDLMAFFPKTVAVKEGDTVIWTFSKTDVAPHTITFLNGTEEPPIIQQIAQPSGPPILTFDPGVALPQNADQPLTNEDVYSSGVIDPAAPGSHSFTLMIGDMTGDAQYECLLHDTEGMKGTLTLVK